MDDLKTLLELQGLDLRIHACRKREQEIPKQKTKFDTRRQRLQEELTSSEERVKQLQVEQGSLQTQIDRNLEQTRKWETQLSAVKKNDEYQALLHEIAAVKRTNDELEERVIALEYEIDETKERLVEDKKRIAEETKAIEAECAVIDQELQEAKAERAELEAKRTEFKGGCDPGLLSKYERIHKRHSGTRVIVPLVNGVCTGCHMAARAQVINEILEGKLHACAHCGRLLYDEEALAEAK